MTEVDLDYLVSLIEERTVIWDTSNSDYKNKFIKQDAWRDICEILFENFQEYDNNEKSSVVNELIKKWRGIKDNFLKYEKKLTETNQQGAGSKPVKEYHLYKQLLFLKKNLQHATDDHYSVKKEKEEERTEKLKPRLRNQKRKRKISDIQDECYTIKIENVNEEETIEETTPRSQSQSRNRNAGDFQDDVTTILKEPESRHISFFKAILPSVEKLDDNQTLIFQSRVLQILTDLCQPALAQDPLTDSRSRDSD